MLQHEGQGIGVVQEDQVELKIAMELKYGNVNLEGIQVWFNVIKQEPKQRVQSYYDRLEKVFSK